MTKRRKLLVAFDVDGTLISLEDDSPREDIIELLKMFKKEMEYFVIVWSGGGIQYAERWVQRLGLEEYVDKVMQKDKLQNGDIWIPDITFDDAEVTLGKVNVQVGNAPAERW